MMTKRFTSRQRRLRTIRIFVEIDPVRQIEYRLQAIVVGDARSRPRLDSIIANAIGLFVSAVRAWERPSSGFYKLPLASASGYVIATIQALAENFKSNSLLLQPDWAKARIFLNCCPST